MDDLRHPATDLASRLSDPGLLATKAYLAGRWVDGGAGTLAVDNPARGDVIAEVADCTPDDAARAIDAAAEAQRIWAARTAKDRAGVLRRWFDVMMEHQDDLATILTAEQGKPLAEARGEIAYGAAFVEFFAEEAKRIRGEILPGHMENLRLQVIRQPVGVVASITPWNFPNAMITRKAAPALAAGCAFVARPASETPLSALALAELADRVGFPPAVVNVVTGDAATVVESWLTDPRVRALSFTGSTEVGRHLYRRAADNVKRLVLELGGHAPFLVFADTDLDLAVEEAIKAKFATTGQDCLGANRFLIERPVYDAFAERFAAKAGALTMGPGREDRDLGPLMNAGAVAKQEAHVADALERGARLLTGGKRSDLGPLFFEPTVLTDVPLGALAFTEETFGPVAVLAPFDAEDEAIGIANDTEYGLVAYLHSADPRRIYRATRALRFGMVAVNRTKVTGAPIPFGGMKQSGLGREGARFGLEAFTEIKYVCRDWA
jgi:aspartate-semialdehyde dehydrogenase